MSLSAHSSAPPEVHPEVHFDVPMTLAPGYHTRTENDIAKIGYVIFSGLSCKNNISLLEKHGRLTPQNSILDAEIYAMLAGLQDSLSLGPTGRIYLFSDCQSALRIFQPRVCSDLHDHTQNAIKLASSTSRHIIPPWVKGHSTNIGNIKADLLARTATSPIDCDLTSGPSYSDLYHTIRTQSTNEWTGWFFKKPDDYARKPTANRNHHKGSTRLDSIALFKLRSNKGWHPTYPVGTQPSPPCRCDHTSPRDGKNIVVCPIYSLARSPEIVSQIHLDRYTVAIRMMDSPTQTLRHETPYVISSMG